MMDLALARIILDVRIRHGSCLLSEIYSDFFLVNYILHIILIKKQMEKAWERLRGKKNGRYAGRQFD